MDLERRLFGRRPLRPVLVVIAALEDAASTAPPPRLIGQPRRSGLQASKRLWRRRLAARRDRLRRNIWALGFISSDQALDGEYPVWSRHRSVVDVPCRSIGADCESFEVVGDGIPWVHGEPMPLAWAPDHGCGAVCPLCALPIGDARPWWSPLHPHYPHDKCADSFWKARIRAGFEAEIEYWRLCDEGGRGKGRAAADAWAWAHIAGGGAR